MPADNSTPEPTGHHHEPPGLGDVAALLAKARAVVCLTGAGVSAESRIPTFRDAMTGLWASFDPMQLATPQAYEADPEMVSRWYDFRREKCRDAEPNPGHLALVRMEQALSARSARFDLITQNVDGLHTRAGSSDPIEIHGSIEIWRDTETGEEYGPHELPCPFPEYPPKAPSGASLRPGVVWFGEMLPEQAMRRVTESLNSCDLFFSIGTSAVVYPAAGFAEIAQRRGASVVEINTEPTPATGAVDHALQGPSGVILPRLVRLAFAE